jgi:peptidoglycan-associated lipoprotein
MARSLLFIITVITLSVACKKQVEVPDLPIASSAVPAVAAAPPTPARVIEPVERMQSNFQRVRFGYDSAVLDSGSKETLMANVEIMREYPELGLMIQGHCDERGSTDYNLALGERRAQAVAVMMRSAGIAPSRLGTRSMGEEVPLAVENGEYAWSQNRRAEFVIVGGDVKLVKGTVEGQ